MSNEVKCQQCGAMVSQSITQCDCGAYVPRTPVPHTDALLDSLLKFQAWHDTGQAEELIRLRAENEKREQLLVRYERRLRSLLSGRLPDDDEPITAEWAESPLCTATGREDVWLRIYDDCFEMMVKGDGWNVLRLPAVRTRGDVRQLVRLLGRE